jgi:DNA-directed RNA polymerase subunit RPC12/RpoP
MKQKPTYYPCSGCGAIMVFSPAKGHLLCPYCSSEEKIQTSTSINSYETPDILRQEALPKSTKREIQCPKCGVNYSFKDFQVSTSCQYCSTPAILDFENPIKPESIAPFKVEQKEAHKIFGKWIGSLWFAPNELKHLVDTQKRLTGFYLPYWLFDASSQSYYTGERGEAYYVTVERRVIVDGRERIVQEQERRIRWYPVSGEVYRDFRDISISASEVIPYELLQSLRSRASNYLVALDKRFLSGFDTREYTIPPRESYEKAKIIMRRIIRGDVLRDIGGDEQRIHSINTKFSQEYYRHSLFPVWSTHFKYKGKNYYYAIDGFTGEIVGERPYSYWKIFFLTLFIMGILLIIFSWDKIEIYLKAHFG